MRDSLDCLTVTSSYLVSEAVSRIKIVNSKFASQRICPSPISAQLKADSIQYKCLKVNGIQEVNGYSRVQILREGNRCSGIIVGRTISV